MKKEIYILGVGHNTAVIIDLVELIGYKIAGLYHYDSKRVGEKELGYEIIGSYDKLFKMKSLSGHSFALSMGDNKKRKELFEAIIEKGGNVPTLIHPSAIISKYSNIEEGAIIQANSVLQANTQIGANCVISFNVVIAHNTMIDKHCFISGQTIVGAYTHVCEGVLIGVGTTTLSGKVSEIGRWSTIGGGSVVTKNVEEYRVVYGNPAKAH